MLILYKIKLVLEKSIAITRTRIVAILLLIAPKNIIICLTNVEPQ